MSHDLLNFTISGALNQTYGGGQQISPGERGKANTLLHASQQENAIHSIVVSVGSKRGMPVSMFLHLSVNLFPLMSL